MNPPATPAHMPGQLELFDAAPFHIDPTLLPGERLSAGARRTRRQYEQLTGRIHPLAYLTGGLAVHPDAPRAADRDAPGPRCGTCQWRQPMSFESNRAFPKCTLAKDGISRISRCETSDVRAWWPACTDYQPQGSEPHADTTQPPLGHWNLA